MPKGMQAIYTNTFAGNVTGQVNFNNIPQTYTDLKIVVSQRNSSANLYESLAFRFDSDGAVYSSTAAYGDGSGSSSNRTSGNSYLSYNGGLSVTGGNATANVFGIYEIYIPNYTSSLFKQFTIDAVTENVGFAHCDLGAGLYRANSPIKFFQLGGYTGSPLASTSITIYGISR